MGSMRRRRTPVGRAPFVAALVFGSLAIAYGSTREAGPARAPLPTTARPSPAPASAHRLPAAAATSGPSITIPVLGVIGGIEPATVVGGVLSPPRKPSAVGLWAGSADLGSPRGEVTIAGHVNWAGMPPFVFGRLADLAPGDVIKTTDRLGSERTWRVNRVYARPKSLPVDRDAFAGRTGPSRLVLITCGGTFDDDERSYVANVYVFANPVGQTADRPASG